MPDERTPHEGNLAPGARRGIIKRGWAVARASWDAIFERKRAEEALRESEERFRVSLMNSPVVVFSQDSELRYTWIHNPVPGFNVEDILGKTDEDLLPPEEASRLTAIKRRVLDSGASTREEIHATARGELIFHDLTLGPLRDATGTIVGLTGASFDISGRRRAEEALRKAHDELELRVQERTADLQRELAERERAEEALRESEERYRSITDDVLDSSAVGIFILDPAFRVVWVNRSLERYFGIRRDELVGKDKRQLIRQRIRDTFEDPEGFAGKVLATYDDNTYVENFECHVLPTGEREERWLEHWSQPIGSGLYAGGRIEHYTDITERKLAEEQLRVAREELEGRVERQMLRRNPYGLTFRELTVLHLVGAGRSDKEIGLELGISPLTASKHVSNILTKMNVASRTEASVRAVKEGLLD